MTSNTECKNTTKIRHLKWKIKELEEENWENTAEIEQLKDEIKELEEEECVKTAYERNIIKPPRNKSLPFFAYGFYKPHQLAYPVIEDFVKGTPKKAKVKAKLKQINGIPVLIEEDYENYVEGYLINFKDGKEYAAYKKVGYSRNNGIYEWKVMDIDDQRANVLVSSKPELFKGDGEWYNNYDFNSPKYDEELDIGIECYDWRMDPIFKKPTKYIRKLLKNDRPTKNEEEDYEKFLDLQMFYMLLWVSIDRFLSFRYGETKKNNVIFLSEEESFKNALKKHVKEDERVFYDRKNVYCTRDLRDYELNPNKPTCSAMFFYTIRNNVVHNGKALKIEQEMLLKALKLLLNIFDDVVDATWEE